MRVLLAHCDHRGFEVERFGAAWVRAGGDPGELVAVTPATLATVLPGLGGPISGLLLTGGPDLEPARYGVTPPPGMTIDGDRPRDALDLELLARAEAGDWPVLGVCYGCQVLNVFLGGTLVLDLDSAGKPGHKVKEPNDHLAHPVDRSPRSRLLATLPERFAVNSRHHQAVDRVGATLEVVATAPDGVVEAIEQTDTGRFVLGVQWHPENLAQGEHVEVFRAFRAACLAFGTS
jgi:putative glutamine amidotransferase